MCVEESIVNTVARKVFDRLERFTFTGQLAHPELPPGKTCAAYVCEWLWAHGKQKHLDVHLCQHLYKEIFGEIPAKLRTFQRYPRQQQVQFKIFAALIARTERAQAAGGTIAPVDRWAKGDMMFSRTHLRKDFLQFIWDEYRPDENTFQDVCDIVRPLVDHEQTIHLGAGTVVTVSKESVQTRRERRAAPQDRWPFDAGDDAPDWLVFDPSPFDDDAGGDEDGFWPFFD